MTTPSTSPIAQPVRQCAVAENARRLSDCGGAAPALRDELIRNGESLVEDRDALVELVRRDVERRADHYDVPVRHEVEPPLERRPAQPRDRRQRLARGVERDEGLARVAVPGRLGAPEGA